MTLHPPPLTAATETAPTDPWVALDKASSLDAAAAPWLRLQLAVLGASGGAVFHVSPAGPRLAARLGVIDIDTAAELAAAAIHDPAASYGADPDAERLIAQSVEAAGGVVAVAVVVLSHAAAQPAAVRALRWGVGALAARAEAGARAAAHARLAAMAAAHAGFAAILEADSGRAAALALATRLAHAADADRVSLGLRSGAESRLIATSHSAETVGRLALGRATAAAMDEAIDQQAVLRWPTSGDEPVATRAQRDLARRHGGGAVATIPFRDAQGALGAAVFERPVERPFTAEEIERLDFALALAGPALAEKRRADRPLLLAARDAAVAHLKRLFGPRHFGRKLALAALIAAVTLGATWRGPYRVTADAVLEGAVERSVAAPFDGFLRTAPHGPGQTLRAGETIATLDDRELTLDRLRWETERRRFELEYGRAVGEGARAEAEILRNQVAQAAARIALIDAQIARARLVAPFDGVILSGDRRRDVGGAVRRGETLFEIARIDGFRVALAVDEARIGDVGPGQTGELVLSAEPGRTIPVSVTRVTPIVETRDGRATVRVDATVMAEETTLRPGLRGVARIDVDERLMLETWTRSFVDWVRLTFWSIFG